MPRGTSQSDEAILQNRVWQLSSLAPALAIWLDSADASTITLNGSDVSQWRDKSGNGVNVWGNPPTYNSAGLNGKPALSFNGNNSLTNASFTFDHTAASMFVVGNMGDPNNYDMFAILYSSYPNYLNAFYMRRHLTQDNISFCAGSAFTLAPYTNNTNGIFSGQYTANGTATVFANGVQGTSSNAENFPGVITNSVLIIGAPAGWLVGSISEIIILSSSVNSADRQKIEGYLAWKWGLRNLPTRHPFLNRIPVIGD